MAIITVKREIHVLAKDILSNVTIRLEYLKSKRFCNGSMACVSIDEELSDVVPASVGERQECVMSP